MHAATLTAVVVLPTPALLVRDRVERAHCRLEANDAVGRSFRLTTDFARSFASEPDLRLDLSLRVAALQPFPACAGYLGGRRPNLPAEVEVPLGAVRARRRASAPAPPSRGSSPRRRAPRLLARVAPALPGDERAALAQQRRRVLEQDVQAREGPRRDDVAGRRGLPPRPPPGRVTTSTFVEPQLLRRLLEELRLLADALDEDDARLRARERQHETREAGAGPEVGDRRRRRAASSSSQARERVGDVDLDAGRRVADRRQRMVALLDELAAARAAAARPPRQRVLRSSSARRAGSGCSSDAAVTRSM